MGRVKSVEQIMKNVFSQPTAPFRENWVLNSIEKELKNLRVPYFKDRWGNIIAGVTGPKTLKTSRRVALLAHTDHPGFHIVSKIKENLFQAQWHGGFPPKTFKAKVSIHNPQFPGKRALGSIVSKKFSKKAIFQIKLKGRSHFPINQDCFGAFAYPGFSKSKSRVHTRAADDLSGVTIILSTFARLKTNEKKNMLGIFTRAEEVGFKGTLGIIYENLLGKENSVISLEASRQLVGARIGQGPVIRLGDKKTLFDSIVTSRLDEAAAVLIKKQKNFKVQRRIMNGGTCEATPFNLHNIKASGIAVPLGNYHNQRPDGKPGPEFIDLHDVEKAVQLCVEFYRQASRNVDPIKDYMKNMASGFKSYKKYFQQKVSFKNGF
jgi:putative aminopeptidase FrvX